MISIASAYGATFQFLLVYIFFYFFIFIFFNSHPEEMGVLQDNIIFYENEQNQRVFKICC